MRKPNLDYIRNRWIPALLSGEYKQTQECLHDDYGFCCLGVVCDLMHKDGLLPDWEKGENDYAIDGSSGVLPVEAAKYLGLPGIVGPAITLGKKYHHSLVRANDAGVSFSDIASGLSAWCDEQERTDHQPNADTVLRHIGLATNGEQEGN